MQHVTFEFAKAEKFLLMNTYPVTFAAGFTVIITGDGKESHLLGARGPLIHFLVPSSSPSPDPEQNAWEKEMK